MNATSNKSKTKQTLIKLITELIKDGYTQTEIAQKMGISRQAVSQLLAKEQ